jgi:hypothetical protein
MDVQARKLQTQLILTNFQRAVKTRSYFWRFGENRPLFLSILTIAASLP